MPVPENVINIERATIGSVIIFPGAAPEGDFSGIFDFIKEQVEADADPKIMREDGYPVAEDAVAEPDDTPTSEEQAELDSSQAEALAARFNEAKVNDRAKYLRRVAKHITEVRHVEGLRKQPGHTPKRLEALDERHDDAMEVAAAALKKACAMCDLRNDCKLADNAELWTDAHPYKDDRTGKRRANTSSKIKAVESRSDFLTLLDEGVGTNEQVHCDPAKREQV